MLLSWKVTLLLPCKLLSTYIASFPLHLLIPVIAMCRMPAHNNSDATQNPIPQVPPVIKATLQDKSNLSHFSPGLKNQI